MSSTEHGRSGRTLRGCQRGVDVLNVLAVGAAAAADDLEVDLRAGLPEREALDVAIAALAEMRRKLPPSAA